MNKTQLPEIAQLYVSDVMHRRMSPVRYRFSYRVFGLLSNLDQLNKLGNLSKFISYNRFNLFSFYDVDHGPEDGSALKPWIQNHLSENNITTENLTVYLHSMPRVLGYTFNPISYWFCYTKENQLLAILVEVNNTFGDKHSYLLDAKNLPEYASVRAKKKKNLHVSPLIDMDAEYYFKISQPKNTFTAAIKETQKQKLFLVAAQHGLKKEITSALLLKVFFSLPLMTLKVITMIHWQALKIYLRGGNFYKRPAPPREEVS